MDERKSDAEQADKSATAGEQPAAPAAASTGDVQDDLKRLDSIERKLDRAKRRFLRLEQQLHEQSADRRFLKQQLEQRNADLAAAERRIRRLETAQENAGLSRVGSGDTDDAPAPLQQQELDRWLDEAARQAMALRELQNTSVARLEGMLRCLDGEIGEVSHVLNEWSGLSLVPDDPEITQKNLEVPASDDMVAVLQSVKRRMQEVRGTGKDCDSVAAELISALRDLDVSLGGARTAANQLGNMADGGLPERDRRIEKLQIELQNLTDERQLLIRRLDSQEQQLNELESLAPEHELQAGTAPGQPSVSAWSDPATTSGQVHRLLVTNDSEGSIKYPLYKSTITIGRTPDNDIQIRTGSVSRQHARIINTDSGAVIEDLHSKNGIIVNAQRVRSALLRNGDLIDIGSLQLRYIDLMDDTAGEGSA